MVCTCSKSIKFYDDFKIRVLISELLVSLTSRLPAKILSHLYSSYLVQYDCCSWFKLTPSARISSDSKSNYICQKPVLHPVQCLAILTLALPIVSKHNTQSNPSHQVYLYVSSCLNYIVLQLYPSYCMLFGRCLTRTQLMLW